MSNLTRLSLLFAIFLDLVGFGMAFPDIQLRAEAFGAPGWLIGMVLASYFVTQTFVSPHWGRLSDRIGRKPVLAVCTALSAGSMVIYAFADTVGLILASRIIAGLAAANVVVAQAYFSDKTSDRERQRAMGQMNAAIMLGLIAGPAIGGYLAETGGNFLMGMVAASASALSLVFILFAVPHEKPAKPEAKDGFSLGFGLLKRVPELRPIFFIATAGWFVLACLEGTFGRLIKHNLGYGQFEFGIVFGYESLIGATVGFALGWLSSHASNSLILRLGYLLTAAGVAAMPLGQNLFHLLAAGTFFALGTGLTNPTINTVASLLTPKEKQGELFGVLQATRSVGFFIGPILGGVMFDWVPASPYFLAAGAAVVASALLSIPAKAEAAPAASEA